jgi:hypothetical protein
MRTRLLVLSCMSALALSGCGLTDLLTGGGSARSIVVSAGGDTARIIVPDTVARGTAFNVQISTFGGSCIPDADRTEVSLVDASTVEIRPYDRTNNRWCGDAIGLYLSHTSRLSFALPGVAHIRIIGDRGAVIGGGPRTPVVIDRVVLVR